MHEEKAPKYDKAGILTIPDAKCHMEARNMVRLRPHRIGWLETTKSQDLFRDGLCRPSCGRILNLRMHRQEVRLSCLYFLLQTSALKTGYCTLKPRYSENLCNRMDYFLYPSQFYSEEIAGFEFGASTVLYSGSIADRQYNRGRGRKEKPNRVEYIWLVLPLLKETN